MIHDFNALRNAAHAAVLGLTLSLVPALEAQADADIQADRAVITIPKPRSANLLHLRGIGGRGKAVLRLGGTCHSMPVRLVAGDFEGRNGHIRGPIVLEIRDARLVQALAHGVDLVSDEMAVSSDPSDRSTGILIMSGMDEGTGFVINAGRTVVADIFGAKLSEIPCERAGLVPAQASSG